MVTGTLLALTSLGLAAVVSAQAQPGFTGTIEGMDGGLAGTFEVVDETTLELTGFTLEDGSAPALYWWGSETSDLSSGFRISDEQVTGEHEDEELTIKLDTGKTTSDFSYAGLWCEQFNANFGMAQLSQGGANDGDSGDSDGGDNSNDAVRAGFSSLSVLGAVGAVAVLLG